MEKKINLNKKSFTVEDIIKDITDNIKRIDPESLKGAKEKQAVLVVDNIINSCGHKLLKRGLNLFLYNGRYWELCNPDAKKLFLITSSIVSGIDSIYAKRVDWGKLISEQLFYSIPDANDKPVPDKTLINVLNGTLHINSNDVELKEFNKNDFLFYQLPYKYDPKEECPLLEEYFDFIGFDQDTRNIIYRYWGYALLGKAAPKLEKILILKGLGGTGKSVLFTIVENLFGIDNISHLSLQKLSEGSGVNLTMIEGKLINHSSESESARMDAELIKQLASREPVIARVLYVGGVTIKDIPAFIFNMNNYPSSKDLSGAVVRRFIIIEFEKRIPREKDVKDYGKIIAEAEASGIMNKIIEGAKYVLKHHDIGESENSIKATNNLLTFENSIVGWLEFDGYVPADETESNKKLLIDFYGDYKHFCSEAVYGKSAKGYNLFAPFLRSKGFVTKQSPKKEGRSMVIYAQKKSEIKNETHIDLNGNEITKEENDKILEGLQIPKIEDIQNDEKLPF